MDYSQSSVLVLVLLLWEAGYVFLADGWAEFVQIWNTAAYPKSRKNSFFIIKISRVKTEGQILNIAITPKQLDRFCQNVHQRLITNK